MESISRKEANLFVKSEVSKGYPWLVFAMTKNNKFPSLSKKDFKKLSIEQQNFLNLKWGELFKLSQDEWKVISKFADNDSGTIIDCELCGHEKLNSISEIENMENGTKLIVGSTCINKFDKIQNNSLKDYKEYQKDKQIKERIVYNEEFIEQHFKGIIQAIKDFKEITIDDSVILNRELTNDYNRISKIIKSDYEPQLKKTQSKIDLDIINSTYAIIKDFFVKLNAYKEECKNKRWGITPQIARWCHKNGSPQLIELLQNFGEINIYTVDQIEENDYLNNVISLFKPLLKSNNMKLISNNASSFSIEVNIRKNIVLIVNTIQFLKSNKSYLFDNKKIKLKIVELLNFSKISSKSYNYSLKFICKHPFFRENYKLYYDDTELNEVAFIDLKTEKILVLDYKLFIQEFKKYIYIDKINFKENNSLLNYIKNNSITYSKNDYKYHLKQFEINIDK